MTGTVIETPSTIATGSTRKNLIGFGMRRTDAKNALKKNVWNNAESNIDGWNVRGKNAGRLSMNKSNKRMTGSRSKSQNKKK